MNSNVMWEVICLIRSDQKESAQALFRNRDMPRWCGQEILLKVRFLFCLF